MLRNANEKCYIPCQNGLEESRYVNMFLKCIAQNIKISKQNLKTIRTPLEHNMRYVRAVSALQQLLVRRKSFMEAVRTLWERRVDAVETLCL